MSAASASAAATSSSTELAVPALARFAANDAMLPAHLQKGTGLGMEGLSSDNFAVPRIKLLQQLTPEATRGHASYIESAIPGRFFITTERKAYDTLYVANLFQDNNFTVWKKQTLGGGRLGSASSMAEAQALIVSANVNAADYDIVEEAVQTLAVIDEQSGNIRFPAIYSMSSTAQAVARTWNSNILTSNQGADRFATIWALKSAMKTNKRNQSYFTPNPELVGFADAKLFKDLTDLYTSLQKNRKVEAAKDNG